MDEQKRTKILGGILAAVLVFMVIRPDRRLLEPIRDAENSRSNAEEKFELEEAKHLQLLVARENISRGRDTSLPYSIADAQRLYQSWINNLVEMCNFSRAEVSPGGADPVRGMYFTVDVNVVAEADLESLSRFLYLHEKANLMHRISSIDITSTGSQNNPRMEITLTSQGMSVVQTPNRADIFPVTEITETLDRSATELVVNSAEGFPKTGPFLAQIGREMLNVTAVDGNKWTVERGVEGTDGESHDASARLQWFPVAVSQRELNFDKYQELLAGSPFTKPTPPRVYNPRLAGVTDRTIGPGEEVRITARAENMNKDIGAPAFALEEAADGMEIDSESGVMTWSPPEEAGAESYSGTVVLTQANNEDLRVEKKFTITVKLPNSPPTLKIDDSAVVIIGQPFELEPTAEDDGGSDQLKFALEGESPDGISVDATTGKLSWTPAATTKPQEYAVTLKVSDAGGKSAAQQITLRVQDDHASLTRFTGSVGLDGVAIALFRNLGTNARPQLKVGDRVVVSEIDAELKEISPRHVLLADASGIWKLSLGENLRERQLIEPAAQPETEESSTVQPTDDGPESTDEQEAPQTEADDSSAVDPAPESEPGT